MTGTLLSSENLCAGYRREVLHNISVGFSGGEITSIIGPNGSGKSTLLKALIGIVPKSGGSILVGGTPIEKLSAAAVARRVAYLPQSKKIPELSVMTMVLHGRFAHLSYPRRYRREDIAAAERALRITGLSELAGESISTLSGGTQQRVFLAMALAQDSPVILMDEPTSFMDISHRIKLMELCRELADSGRAVVSVLHDLPMALKYSDKTMVLSEGTLRAVGSPEEVFRSGILDSIFGIKLKRTETETGLLYYY